MGNRIEYAKASDKLHEKATVRFEGCLHFEVNLHV